MANDFKEESTGESGSIIKKIITQKNIILLLLFLIFLNLLYLDVIFIRGSGIKTIEKIISAPSSQTNQNDSTCSSACITKINEVKNNIKKQTSSDITPTITPTPTKLQYQPQDSSSVREYYVPFGTGSGSSSDWQDVSGLQAYVDSVSYPNIKSVVFEASLHIPTGNETASVRLYNATDKHPVWNSEINFNGNSSSIFLTSASISLDSGNKLYKVQMKTQLQYQAILDQSRLHITTK
nr:hypothetical protein [Candidatus Levybacteria bacterium]